MLHRNEQREALIAELTGYLEEAQSYMPDEQDLLEQINELGERHRQNDETVNSLYNFDRFSTGILTPATWIFAKAK